MTRFFTIILALAVSEAAPSRSEEQDGIAYGKALVEANCARCHAVDETGTSRHHAAPPFRTLSTRYPLDALEEGFAEGIVTGHPDMPEFIATPVEIEAIIAYIGSLQKR